MMQLLGNLASIAVLALLWLALPLLVAPIGLVFALLAGRSAHRTRRSEQVVSPFELDPVRPEAPVVVTVSHDDTVALAA